MSDIPEEEIIALIKVKGALRAMAEEFKKRGWSPAVSAMWKAMMKGLDDEPIPSPALVDLRTRKKAMTLEECQTMVNGCMIALANREQGKVLIIATHEIFAAAEQLGTLAIAIADDDSHVKITGMHQQ